MSVVGVGDAAVPAPVSDELYRREILAMVQGKIDEHPRAAQVLLGPSEIGACPTQVAFKIAFGAATGDREGGWAAHRGTLIHGWLDEVFKGAGRFMPDGSQRFYSDLKLPQISALVSGGTLDLYDRLTQTVIDWKCPGDYTMRTVRGGKFSWAYYAQAMTYGAGLEAMGHPVSRVALAFLPACGDDLHGASAGALFRFWPYERDVALGALDYVRRIKDMLEVAGTEKVLDVLPKWSSFCSSCPAFVGSGDRRAKCPGVVNAAPSRARRVLDPANPFA